MRLEQLSVWLTALPAPPLRAPGHQEGFAGAAEPRLGVPGLSLLVLGLEPHGDAAGLVLWRPENPGLGHRR